MSLLQPPRRPLLMPAWARNSLWRQAAAVPSLDLNFAVTKTVGPLVSFNRASSATYIDSAGTLRSAVTNLLLRSEEFDNASWTKTGLLAFGSGSTLNATIAPDGQTTADLLTENSSTSEHRVETAAISWAANTTYTLTVFAKANGRTRIDFFGVGGGNFTGGRNVSFNLSTGAVIATDGAVGSIEAKANGWYRIRMTFTASAAPSASQLYIRFLDNFNNFSYTGDGTSGIFLWGAQLEQSSTVGEYIPTTSTINSAPRFDHNPTTGESLGLLVEDQRTNSIRNNTMVGAVAGTPGTSPTNWTLGSLSGLTQTIVGTGTESGIAYIDIRIFGTTSSALFFGVRPENITVVAATPNSIWTSTFYVRLVGGSLTNVTGIKNVLTNFNSSGAALNQYAVALLTPTSAALATQRYSLSTTSATFADATTAFVISALQVEANSGAAIDITLRIGLPQLELGAFATSVILTDNTAPLGKTRNADVANITGANFSSWYRQDEGTVFAFSSSYGATNSSRRIAFATDGTTANRFGLLYNNSNNPQIVVASAGTLTATPGVALTGATYAIAAAYKLDDYAISAAGSAPSTDTSGALPVSINQLSIGSQLNTEPLNGTIRRLTYWPQRLPNSTLQAITQ